MNRNILSDYLTEIAHIRATGAATRDATRRTQSTYVSIVCSMFDRG